MNNETTYELHHIPEERGTTGDWRFVAWSGGSIVDLVECSDSSYDAMRRMVAKRFVRLPTLAYATKWIPRGRVAKLVDVQWQLVPTT